MTGPGSLPHRATSITHIAADSERFRLTRFRPPPKENLAVAPSAGHDNREFADKLVTASALKLRMAAVLAGDKAGRAIGVVMRRRIRHMGLWFDTRSTDFSPQVRAQMFWGNYESAETRMIRSFLRGSTTVVELGSSLGITAAHITQR